MILSLDTNMIYSILHDHLVEMGYLDVGSLGNPLVDQIY